MGFLSFLKDVGSAINPLSGVVQAGASLLGSAMDNSANKKIAEQNYQSTLATNEANKEMNDATNQMNLQISRENNAFNRESAELQNQWNLEQWQRENAYNNPAAQASRLLAAGINPVNAGLDGVSPAGSIQSAETAPASDAGSQQATRFDAPRFDYTQSTFTEGLKNAVLLSQAAMNNYDVNERKQTFKQRMDNLSVITDNLRKQGKLTNVQVSIAKSLDSLKKLTLQDEIAGVRQDLLLKSEQTKNIIADTAKKKAERDFIEFEKDFAIPEQLRQHKQEIDNALQAATMQYNASLAAVAAQRYGADMSYKAAHEAVEQARDAATNAFMNAFDSNQLTRRQLNLLEKHFKLDVNREKWNRSALKYLQDVSKGLAPIALGASLF